MHPKESGLEGRPLLGPMQGGVLASCSIQSLLLVQGGVVALQDQKFVRHQVKSAAAVVKKSTTMHHRFEGRLLDCDAVSITVPVDQIDFFSIAVFLTVTTRRLLIAFNIFL